MKKKIIVFGIFILFMNVVFGGCEEEIKTICDQTKATPIGVDLEITLKFKIEIKNFYPVKGDKWWYNKHINKCGVVGSTDLSLHEKDASEIYELNYYRFPKEHVHLDNTLDEVYIEGGLITKDNNFFTSIFLSYNELKPYMGRVYNVTLWLGEECNTAFVKIYGSVEQFIDEKGSTKVAMGQTLRFEITSTMGDSGTYYRTTEYTGDTDIIWKYFTFSSESDTVNVIATHEGTNQTLKIALTYEGFKKQYFDFQKGGYVSNTEVYFNFII